MFRKHYAAAPLIIDKPVRDRPKPFTEQLCHCYPAAVGRRHAPEQERGPSRDGRGPSCGSGASTTTSARSSRTADLGCPEPHAERLVGRPAAHFAAGDVDAAARDCLAKEQGRILLKQPEFSAGEGAASGGKIALLAFMNLVFETPAHQRAISFEAIAVARVWWRWALDHRRVAGHAARCALRLGQGRRRRGAQVVEVSWVQPRVLGPGGEGALPACASSRTAKIDVCGPASRPVALKARTASSRKH